MSDPKSGVLHDLGYQPYTGERLPQDRRFWVISRNVLGIAWRQKWGVRLPVLLTGLIVIIGCVLIYLQRYVTRFAPAEGGANALLRADRVVLEVSSSLGLIAFVLGVRVGCTAIADDLRVGAFQFYFSRTIRVSDYLLGKLLGISLVIGIPMLGAPLVLSLFRLLLADSWAEALDSARMLPAALAFGVAGTAAYALPAAGCGALMQKRVASMAMYAAFYLLGTAFLEGLAEGADQPIFRALEPGIALFSIGHAVFNVPAPRDAPALWAAVAAIVMYGLVSILLVRRRVARAETAGMGGG
jgi:ABC-2 type transport system permease protein